MDLVFQAGLIGLLQGLSEFIPVSSSAHLVIAPWVLGWGDSALLNSLAFDVFLHLGTGVALLIYFAGDIWRLLRAWVASIVERRIGADPERRLAWLLVVATVPAAVIGVLGEEAVSRLFHSGGSGARLAIAGFMVVGAAALYAADRFGSQREPMRGLTFPRAAVIGFSQAFALLPGISRSGATITTALGLGLTREAAARFSFLLATPITIGAGLYGSRHMLTEAHSGTEWLAIGVGFVAAAISGMIAIGFLLSWLRRHSVGIFSAYRVLFAIGVVALVLIGR